MQRRQVLVKKSIVDIFDFDREFHDDSMYLYIGGARPLSSLMSFIYIYQFMLKSLEAMMTAQVERQSYPECINVHEIDVYQNSLSKMIDHVDFRFESKKPSEDLSHFPEETQEFIRRNVKTSSDEVLNEKSSVQMLGKIFQTMFAQWKENRMKEGDIRPKENRFIEMVSIGDFMNAMLAENPAERFSLSMAYGVLIETINLLDKKIKKFCGSKYRAQEILKCTSEDSIRKFREMRANRNASLSVLSLENAISRHTLVDRLTKVSNTSIFTATVSATAASAAIIQDEDVRPVLKK